MGRVGRDIRVFLACALPALSAACAKGDEGSERAESAPPPPPTPAPAPAVALAEEAELCPGSEWQPWWREGKSNNWWIEFAIGGGRVESAELEVVGERTIPLRKEHGKWLSEAKERLATGAVVVLHARNELGQSARTRRFAYLEEREPKTCAGTPSTPPCPSLAAGMVTIQFDDNFISQYELARAPLKVRGVRASLVLNSRPLATNWGGPHMTFAQTKELVGDGHEVCSHSVAHIPLSTLSEREIEVQLRDSKRWLEKHLGAKVDHYAAPTGQFHEPGMAIAKRHYASYRGGSGGMNYAGDDPYSLFADVVLGTSPPSEVQQLIDEARASRGWRILVFHRFGKGPSERWDTYPVESFEQVLDGILVSGIDIVTIDEGVRRIRCTTP